jgi:hypothetical protein
MKPSRIVKSAYRCAVKAGYKGSLKAFARESIEQAQPHNNAATYWFKYKRDGKTVVR